MQTEHSEVGTGHINRTLLVTAESRRYVLQALNCGVFPRPEAVMSNIAQVEAAFADCADVTVPHYLTCRGKNYAEADGEIWRMYAYCEGSPCVRELRRVGYSYGTFIRVMSRSGAEISPVIDGFHDFGRYYARLEQVCSDIPPELTALQERTTSSSANPAPSSTSTRSCLEPSLSITAIWCGLSALTELMPRLFAS